MYSKRAAIVIAFTFALLPLWASGTGQKKSADKNETYTGKVVSLADIPARQGVKIDADQQILVLDCDDGKIYPLVKDEGARMFFKDAKLLNRPMKLTARLLPKTQFLQVITVHSVVNGKLHDVYYWCDVCVIKRFEAGICDCCGAPMDFRETPYKGD
jgi:hypothetical protein